MIKGENAKGNFISVIITAYNRKEFLLDSIKSAVNQTLRRDFYEIIVINNFIDGKIDKYMLDNNIKNIKMEGKVGEFLHAGIMNAKGNIISFLDDDDQFTNEKLEFVYNNFRGRVVYIHNGFVAIGKDGNRIDFNNTGVDFNLSCISVRRHIINKNLENIEAMPDTFMFLSALDSGRIFKTNNSLTIYRVHDKNTSINYSAADGKNIYKRYIASYKQFCNFFSKRVRKTIRGRITEYSIELYLRGELIRVNKIFNYIFNNNSGLSIVHRIKMTVAFQLFRFNFGRQIIESKMEAILNAKLGRLKVRQQM
ncbi:MAG: glycosyltransferase family 2 protein [Thermoplasmatales archaeon]